MGEPLHHLGGVVLVHARMLAKRVMYAESKPTKPGQ